MLPRSGSEKMAHDELELDRLLQRLRPLEPNHQLQSLQPSSTPEYPWSSTPAMSFAEAQETTLADTAPVLLFLAQHGRHPGDQMWTFFCGMHETSLVTGMAAGMTASGLELLALEGQLRELSRRGDEHGLESFIQELPDRIRLLQEKRPMRFRAEDFGPMVYGIAYVVDGSLHWYFGEGEMGKEKWMTEEETRSDLVEVLKRLGICAEEAEAWVRGPIVGGHLRVAVHLSEEMRVADQHLIHYSRSSRSTIVGIFDLWRDAVFGEEPTATDLLGRGFLLSVENHFARTWGALQGEPNTIAALAEYHALNPSASIPPLAKRYTGSVHQYMLRAPILCLDESGKTYSKMVSSHEKERLIHFRNATFAAHGLKKATEELRNSLKGVASHPTLSFLGRSSPLKLFAPPPTGPFPFNSPDSRSKSLSFAAVSLQEAQAAERDGEVGVRPVSDDARSSTAFVLNPPRSFDPSRPSPSLPLRPGHHAINRPRRAKTIISRRVDSTVTQMTSDIEWGDGQAPTTPPPSPNRPLQLDALWPSSTSSGAASTSFRPPCRRNQAAMSRKGKEKAVGLGDDDELAEAIAEEFRVPVGSGESGSEDEEGVWVDAQEQQGKAEDLSAPSQGDEPTDSEPFPSAESRPLPFDRSDPRNYVITEHGPWFGYDLPPFLKLVEWERLEAAGEITQTNGEAAGDQAASAARSWWDLDPAEGSFEWMMAQFGFDGV